MILRKIYILFVALAVPCLALSAQNSDCQAADSIRYSQAEDTVMLFPRRIPYLLSRDDFIPDDRISMLVPWMGAPVVKPHVHVVPVYGFSGYSFGTFTVDHWDKFFANLLGYNEINVPHMIDSQQMILGNTISLGRKRRLFFANGILYGRHYGTWGNMIGLGTREGLIYRPTGYIILSVWTQEYQSVYAYSPVVYPVPDEGTASIRLPASPVMVSFGAQAYFLVGQFWIGIGASFWNAADPEKH